MPLVLRMRKSMFANVLHKRESPDGSGDFHMEGVSIVSDEVNLGSNQMAPISFFITFEGKEEKVEFFYNSYVADVLKKASELFDIPEAEMKKYRLRCDGETLFKVSRLYDCDVLRPDCVCELYLR